MNKLLYIASQVTSPLQFVTAEQIMEGKSAQCEIGRGSKTLLTQFPDLRTALSPLFGSRSK